MRQKYTNVQGLIETIRERKSQGETNREIGTSLDLTLKQVQQLITRAKTAVNGCSLKAACFAPRGARENYWRMRRLSEIMSWQNCIGSNMAASLATQTIWDALITEKVTGGLTIHSDQGSQYTSTAYFA